MVTASSTPLLLSCATIIALVSFLSARVFDPKNLNSQLAVGYLPIALGCVCMWLCFRARKRAKHKRAVLLYTALLAPFAFSYPAWLAFLCFEYASGRYTGPMP